ncbi:hypothetical protein [Providencia rettgeri]|uniref:hypothetical protein n=1 Tax=Providencia rettgeri TaxID=587 RepID=UPI0011836673|nr:hypothetical protein [Providencia rettgeri]
MTGSAHQIEIQLFPVKEVEVNGVHMGVLNDGSPFLSLRGLAKLCGVNHTTLLPLTTNWLEEQTKPRGKKIKEILSEHNYKSDKLYTVISTGGNWDSHAYPDAVCMAILEYYAFDATQGDNTIAARNYRLMARQTLRTYIFKSVGIDPDNPVIGAWKCFQDRIKLNDSIPAGYFSVFREMVDITVPLISAGFELNEKNIIDISAGSRWAHYWKKNEFTKTYGEILKYPHVYPEWFPQRRAGPVDANIYPETALHEFRKWLRDHYVPGGLKDYLADKVEAKAIESKKAIEVLELLKKPELPNKK